jgi:protein involved in polysaccharide export with SLBB domain
VGRRSAGALLSWVLLSSGLAGCGGTHTYPPRSDLVPFTTEQRTTLDTQAGRAYRIQEGDVLKVYFAYERDLNQDGVVVLSDGAASLLGVDRITLAGLTIAEADSALTLAYSHEYREPALSVMIQETQGRRVYVLGEVRNPGYYQVPVGGIEIMNAITMASGFTDDAARDGTLVVRVTNEGYQFQEVDLDGFGSAQFAPLSAMPLRAYDIVYVPRSRTGDFGYFTRTVLVGLGYITRMAYDIYNITHGLTGRY